MRLLDLFCGAGGASRGYADAGFDVVGVDINPQQNYPYVYVQADALDWLDRWDPTQDVFDAIHASPPCQSFTAYRRKGHGVGDTVSSRATCLSWRCRATTPGRPRGSLPPRTASPTVGAPWR
jgi:DNA (cytosine-5)-methyltransferase 1